MTPARKKALEWVADNSVLPPCTTRDDAPRTQEVNWLIKEGLVDAPMPYVGHLTNAGRRALNGDSK